MKRRRFTPHSAVICVKPVSAAGVKGQLKFTKTIAETKSHARIVMAMVLVVMLKLSNVRKTEIANDDKEGPSRGSREQGSMHPHQEL